MHGAIGYFSKVNGGDSIKANFLKEMMMTIYAYENGKFAISQHNTHAEYMADGESLIRAGFEVYGDTK